MTTYTHTTFISARNRLASLLGDPDKVFWSDDELKTYITEALHWWGLMAMYWKESGVVTVTAGNAFYDVRSITNIGGDLLADTDVTDRELINEMCYQLIEPPITSWGGGWVGSEMFSLEEISDLLTQSRDDILRESGAIASQHTYTVNPGVARVDLLDSTIHILRCSIEEVSATGQPLPLWAIDYYQAQGFMDTAGQWPTRRPKAFLTNYTPTLALDLFPDPAVDATLRVYTIQTDVAFDPTTVEQFVGLPNDSCWIAKYRTLADLLSGDGLARAPQMAQYCEKRHQDGLTAMETYQSLLWAEIDGKRMTISPLSVLDAERVDWQGQTPRRPRSIHQLNWNLYAVYPVPDTDYDIEVEVVRKAIIPVDDFDFIQVGREQMQAIYDYAQHVACFKMQGEEFNATIPLLESATMAAMEHQTAQAGSAVNYQLQVRQAQADRLMRPYRRREIVQAANTNDTAKWGSK